jgi:hypothetical protein
MAMQASHAPAKIIASDTLLFTRHAIFNSGQVTLLPSWLYLAPVWLAVPPLPASSFVLGSSLGLPVRAACWGDPTWAAVMAAVFSRCRLPLAGNMAVI